MILSRLIMYAVLEAFLVIATVIVGVVSRNPALTSVPGFLVLGIGYYAVNFYVGYKKDLFDIVYGICDEREEDSRFSLHLEKNKRYYLYRICTVTENGKPSYFFLRLQGYNQMREGQSYIFLFWKPRFQSEEYTERNMVYFRPMAQSVRAENASDKSRDESAGSDTETPGGES